MSSDDESEPAFMLKMVALGDGAVGKTSCIMRYTENSFGETYKATIGTSIALKNVEIDVWDKETETTVKRKVQVVLWDLAGQPTYKDLRQRYMIGSSMAFIVYDVTRPPTFLNVHEWYRNFRQSCPDSVVAVVGNKIDRDDRLVPPEAGEMLKKWLDVIHIETSAKEGTNVDLLFTELARRAIAMEIERCGSS
ncbi:MAG: GTP-binding protein [Candidatus Thorarchaeota archaeon]